MKKLITICLLLATAFIVNVQAQNAPLNKQQTLEYIEKLYKETFEYNPDKNFTVFNVTLDGKILQVIYSNGLKSRIELFSNQTLTITKDDPKYGYDIIYNPPIKNNKNILTHISLESDAKRLKKALEHLIEILKTEKSTDPFGE